MESRFLFLAFVVYWLETLCQTLKYTWKSQIFKLEAKKKLEETIEIHESMFRKKFFRVTKTVFGLFPAWTDVDSYSILDKSNTFHRNSRKIKSNLNKCTSSRFLNIDRLFLFILRTFFWGHFNLVHLKKKNQQKKVMIFLLQKPTFVHVFGEVLNALAMKSFRHWDSKPKGHFPA